MTAIINLSFDTWLQTILFQNDSKICEAEVTLTPLINKICKPCPIWQDGLNSYEHHQEGFVDSRAHLFESWITLSIG